MRGGVTGEAEVADDLRRVPRLGAGERYLLVNPLFHSFGLKAGVVSCLLAGATIHPMAQFDAEEAARTIERERLTLMQVRRRIREDVESGLLLSEAMARHPRVFSRLFVSMVEAGEAAGILDVVLDRVALQIEKEQKIRRRVKSAMVYPTVVMVFAIVVLVAMLLFLVPVFTSVFAQLNGELPALTRDVLVVSD
mgnify:CR=1 FL=1